MKSLRNAKTGKSPRRSGARASWRARRHSAKGSFLLTKRSCRMQKGRRKPVRHYGHFHPSRCCSPERSMTDHPDCAGNKAIKLLLSEIQDEVPELIKFGRVRRMPRAPVLFVLMVFLVELPPFLQHAPAQSPVTMDTLKADREKRETPEEAKRPWDGLYLT